MSKFLIILAVVVGVLGTAALVVYLNRNSLALWYMGVEDPKIENEKSLTEYAQKVGFNSNQDFYLIDSAIFDEAVKKFPTVNIYDKSGRMVMDAYCFADLPQFADTLYESKTFDTWDSTRTLDMELKRVRTFNGHTVQNDLNYDFTIVYYWTKWLGEKVNREKLAALEQRIQKQNSTATTKVRLIKVNADSQEAWGEAFNKEHNVVIN